MPPRAAIASASERTTAAAAAATWRSRSASPTHPPAVSSSKRPIRRSRVLPARPTDSISTLSNDTSQQQTFTLQASGPTGWTVDARPSSSNQAATAVVDAGSSTQIQVTAQPPVDATAGSYPIAVEAVGGPTVAHADLAVEIVGSYTMNVTTPDGRLNADVTAGAASPMTVEVHNTGSAPLAGVAMSATPPQGWKVTFDPAVIEAIAAEDRRR